jgi:hypothetical protein
MSDPMPGLAQLSPPVGHRRRETLLSMGAGLLGAVGAGVLLLLLLPGSTGQPPVLVSPVPARAGLAGAEDRETTTTSVTTTTVSMVTIAPATSAVPVIVESKPPDPTPAVAPEMTSPADASGTNPSTSAASHGSLPQLLHNGATAVPLRQGEFLLTTTQAVGLTTGTVEVTWGDAPPLLATVVARGSGFTVLQLDRQVTAGSGFALAEALPAPGTWVTVGLTEQRRGVVVEREGGLALAGVPTHRGAVEGVPVLDAAGQLVGLCSTTRQGTVLIPVTDAQSVIDERRQHAWLGISATTTTSANSIGDAEPAVLVTEVAVAGPADRAGVRTGDLVTAFDDQPVQTVVQLSTMVERRRPGDEVSIGIRRGDLALELVVSLNARPFSL